MSETIEITNLSFHSENSVVDKLRANIPEEIKSLKQFVVRYGKRPYAWLTDENKMTPSWSTDNNGFNKYKQKTELFDFEQAVNYFNRNIMMEDDKTIKCNPSGLGIIMTGNGLVGGDLDKCRDPITGFVTPWTQEILLALQPFYSEVSPSGTGIRFFCYGDMEYDTLKATGPQDQMTAETWENILQVKPDAETQNELELYTNGHHLSLTGDRLDEFCYEGNSADFNLEAVEPWIRSKKATPSKTANHLVGDEKWTEYSNDPFRNLTLETVGGMPVAGDLGIIEQYPEVLGCHPIHGSEHTHKNYSVNENNGRWHCYRHGTGGDVVSFLGMKYGLIDCEDCVSGATDGEIYLKIWERAYKEGLDVDEPPTSGGLFDRLAKDPELIIDTDFLADLGRLPMLQQQSLIAEARKGKLISSELKSKTILSEAAKLAHQPVVEDKKESEFVPQDIKEEAERLLNEGRAFEYVLGVWQKRHHGDANLGKGLFLSVGAQSCLSSKGIHIHACGPRGMGKSDAAEKASEAIHPDYLMVGSASPKTLYYLGERLPAGSIVYLDDIGWSDEAAQMFKTCTTFYKTGAVHSVVTDGPEGKMVKQFRTAPRIAFWITTADAQTDEQVRDRLLRIDVTEDPRHTQQVVRFIMDQRIHGAAVFDEHELQVCREVVRQLKGELLDVVIPFANYIQFQGDARGATIFMDLVSAFAIWRHKIRGRDSNGAVVAEYEDYKDAERFFNGINGHSDKKFTPKELRILQAIKDAGTDGITRDELQKKTGLSGGELSNIINGRGRDEQNKYGLLHKCTDLTSENVVITNDGVSKKRLTYKLPREYEILEIYGSAVRLNADEKTVRNSVFAVSTSFHEFSNTQSTPEDSYFSSFQLNEENEGDKISSPPAKSVGEENGEKISPPQICEKSENLKTGASAYRSPLKNEEILVKTRKQMSRGQFFEEKNSQFSTDSNGACKSYKTNIKRFPSDRLAELREIVHTQSHLQGGAIDTQIIAARMNLDREQVEDLLLAEGWRPRQVQLHKKEATRWYLEDNQGQEDHRDHCKQSQEDFPINQYINNQQDLSKHISNAIDHYERRLGIGGVYIDDLMNRGELIGVSKTRLEDYLTKFGYRPNSEGKWIKQIKF